MSYRAARLAVIVLSALIILALIGLVGGGVWKLSGHKSSHAAAASAEVFVLPAGATVVSSGVQPGRLVLHLKVKGADEIDIVDLDDGHLVARIVAAPPPAAK